ncbi:hypothetical protein [Bacteroides acidifaciens]
MMIRPASWQHLAYAQQPVSATKSFDDAHILGKDLTRRNNERIK